MSIDPVQATAPVVETQAPHPKNVSAHSADAKVRQDPIPPDPGTQPNRESHASSRAAKSSEMPGDEVQVQRDAQNQIVIRYVDGSGKVIFQVPSSQMLALHAAIEQALEQQAQSRTNANRGPAIGPGGTVNEH